MLVPSINKLVRHGEEKGNSWQISRVSMAPGEGIVAVRCDRQWCRGTRPEDVASSLAMLLYIWHSMLTDGIIRLS